MQKHLAIFELSLASKILSGEKTIDSRFSKSKIAPFGVVSVGDLVYIKPSGKEIIGQFRVQKVLSFEGLTRSDLDDLKSLYGQRILAEDSYWSDRGDRTYGTLIFIDQVVPLMTSPITLRKKDLRGWMVLS